MKIISRGVNPVTKPVQATCRNCNTVIEFSPFEAKYVNDQRDGDFYEIACPECAFKITKAVK